MIQYEKKSNFFKCPYETLWVKVSCRIKKEQREVTDAVQSLGLWGCGVTVPPIETQ